MSRRKIDPWVACLRRLEHAVLAPGQHFESLRRSLEQILCAVPAAGTALVWSSPDHTVPWTIMYVGKREADMHRRLSELMEASHEDAPLALREQAPYLADAGPPMSFPLKPKGSPSSGLWVVWPYPDSRTIRDSKGLERFRQLLEAFLEVRHREALFFKGRNNALEPELTEALTNGDMQGVPVLLTLARLAANADFVYWGGVQHEAVEVGTHLGARNSGFGFEIPVGQGMGGRAIGTGKVFEVPDYLNCQYRYPSVSEICDREEIRSGLAIPVRGSAPDSGAVLYAARRTVNPFSVAERTLLLRLARSIEPTVDGLSPVHHFFPSNTDQVMRRKSELRGILSNSNDVQDIELWLRSFIKGPGIITDHAGRPYSPGSTDRSERLVSCWPKDARDARVVPLTQDQINGAGYLYLWPSVTLPPEGWPDFLDDVVSACNVVIQRAEQAHGQLGYQRSKWLRNVIEGSAGPRLRRDGYRLGLPVDQGEVWAVAWRSTSTGSDFAQNRLRMLIEDVTLTQLGSPLIVLDDFGVLMLGAQVHCGPSTLRDELLRYLAPSPVWVAHGASYSSFESLKNAIRRTTRLVKKAELDEDERYVLDVTGSGLAGLLENPNLSDDLDVFASKLFEPLLDYDNSTGSQLAETFALKLTLGTNEVVAKRLSVHTSTVRYRVRRAKQILGTDLASAEDETALKLAAFVWIRRGNPSNTC